MCHCTRLISIILFVLMFSSVPVTAGETGTIITKSGVEYTNVWIVVDRPHKLFLFKWDGEEKQISFDDVAKVLDYRGEDISFRTLEEYDPPWEQKVELTGEWKQLLSDRLWRVSVSANSNFCFVTGQSEDVKGSFGYEFSVTVPFNHRLALRMDVSQLGVDVDYKWAWGIQKIPEQSVIDAEYDISLRRYMVGLQWFQPLDRGGTGGPIWYSTLRVGTIRGRDIRYVYLEDSNTGEVELRKFQYKANIPVLSFGGGAVFPVSQQVGIDVGGEFDLLLSKISIESSDPSGIFDLKFGLIYLFK